MLRPVFGGDDRAGTLAELADQLVHAAVGCLDLGGGEPDLANELLADAGAGAELLELGEAGAGGAAQFAELAQLGRFERLAGAEGRAQQGALRAVVRAYAPAGGLEALEVGQDGIGHPCRVRGRGGSLDESALDRANAIVPRHRRREAALRLRLGGLGVETLATAFVLLFLSLHALDQGGPVRQIRCLQPRHRLGDPGLVGLLDLANGLRWIVGDLDARLRLAAIGADGVAGQQQGPVRLDEVGEAHVGVDLLGRVVGQIAESADSRHGQACHGGHEIMLDGSREEFHERPRNETPNRAAAAPSAPLPNVKFQTI